MAIYAAMNLGLAMENFKRRGHNGLSGIIANKRNVNGEDEKLQTLNEDLECPIVGTIEHSMVVKRASDDALTVAEAFPDDPMVDVYTKIAMEIINRD